MCDTGPHDPVGPSNVRDKTLRNEKFDLRDEFDVSILIFQI